MYLLDTDWVIQTLADRQPAKGTLRRLSGSRVYISYITIGELYEGAFISANPQAHLASLRHFLRPYRLLLLIGATALQHNLTILTFNRRHFERIPEVRLFQPQ